MAYIILWFYLCFCLFNSPSPCLLNLICNVSFQIFLTYRHWWWSWCRRVRTHSTESRFRTFTCIYRSGACSHVDGGIKEPTKRGGAAQIFCRGMCIPDYQTGILQKRDVHADGYNRVIIIIFFCINNQPVNRTFILDCPLQGELLSKIICIFKITSLLNKLQKSNAIYLEEQSAFTTCWGAAAKPKPF